MIFLCVELTIFMMVFMGLNGLYGSWRKQQFTQAYQVMFTDVIGPKSYLQPVLKWLEAISEQDRKKITYIRSLSF